MQKLLSTILFLFVFALGNAQDDSVIVKTKSRIPPPPVRAKGCEDARDDVRCTHEKIYNTAIKNLDAENVQEIINATESDTIKVTIKLRFTSKRNLYLHRTSLRFYGDGVRLDARVNSDVERLPFASEPYASLYEGEKYAYSLGFRLKVDRENNTLIPLYDFDSEKRLKNFPDQFVKHPNCESLTTYEAQKKCFRKEIKKLIAEKFDSKPAKEAGITGVVKAEITIFYDEKGTVKETRVSSENPEMSAQIKQLLSSIPKVQPGALRGKPVKVYSEYTIKFKIK